MKKKKKKDSMQLKIDAVKLLTEHGYKIKESSKNIGIHQLMLGRWKNEIEEKQVKSFPGNGQNSTRSHLKKVFWPNFCVGNFFQVLNILKYACRLKHVSALNLNKNPFFEMASNNI